MPECVADVVGVAGGYTLNRDRRRKINAQIMALIKNILLSDPGDGTSGKISFFAGGLRQWPLSAMRGLAVRWWLTTRGRSAQLDLARLVIADTELVSTDLATCASHIWQILEEICIDQEFFDVAAIFAAKSRSLFDCITGAKDAFCDKFCNKIRSVCMADVKCRATIIPIAPRLHGRSFSIDKENVGLIHRTDVDSWREIIDQPFECLTWNANNGAFAGQSPWFGEDKFSYYAFGIDKGTHAWCADQSLLKIRKLLSVVIAQKSSKKKTNFHTVIAEAPRHYIQFAEKESSIPYCSSGTEPLLPFYASDLLIDQDDIAEIKYWYGRNSALPTDKSNRLDKCCHFINLALNAKSLDGFVFYYISLDALFGQRNDVERSVREGISRFSQMHAARTDWLYELRNEIVHGGSRRVSEWARYERYLSHFNSEPEHDIRKIALECLYGYR